MNRLLIGPFSFAESDAGFTMSVGEKPVLAFLKDGRIIVGSRVKPDTAASLFLAALQERYAQMHADSPVFVPPVAESLPADDFADFDSFAKSEVAGELPTLTQPEPDPQPVMADFQPVEEEIILETAESAISQPGTDEVESENDDA